MSGIIAEAGISQEQVALVGAIAIEWSTVEAKLQAILATAIGKDIALGLSAVTNMSYLNIAATLRSLADGATSTLPTFGPQIATLLIEADRLNTLRNAIIHAIWEGASPEGVSAVVMRFKGRLRNHLEIWSNSQLAQIGDDCATLHEALEQFMVAHELRDEIDAYVARQPSQQISPAPRHPHIPGRSPSVEELLHQLLPSRE